MPWRFLGFIVFFGLVLVFSIFNWKNTCDISLGFTVLRDVPVYLTVFSSFLLGLVCSVPHAIALRLRASRRGKEPPPPKEPGRRGRKKGGKGEGGSGEPQAGGSYPDDGSFGID